MQPTPFLLNYFCDFASGLNMLKKGRLPLETDILSHNPLLQNQPFDDTGSTFSEQVYQQELRHQYDQLPAHLKAMISFDYFCQQSEQKREGIESALKQKSTLANPPAKYPEQWKKLCCLSLFESLEHFGLWHHRAAIHQGLALQLNTASSVFKLKKNEPIMLRAVSYGGERQVQVNRRDPFPGCFALPAELATEQEWRLMKPLQFQAKGLTLARDTVAAIVFGARCSEEMIAEVRQALQHDMRYKSVKYGRIMLHSQRLLLTVKWP